MAYISGNLSDDSRIFVYDINTNSLVHDELFSAGAYEVLGLDPSTKVIVAVRSSNGESLSYGNVLPIDEGYDWGLFTGDDFNGSNGDPPNATYWNVVGDYTQFDIQSNRLYHECDDGEDSYLDSNFEVSGDFNIRVECYKDVHPWQGSGYWYFYLRAGIDADNYMTMARGVEGNVHKFFARGRNDGVWYDVKQTENWPDFTLKIVRSGSTWTAYYAWTSGANETLITTQNNMPTTPMFVRIGCDSGTYNQGTARSASWDDFELIAGTASAR